MYAKNHKLCSNTAWEPPHVHRCRHTPHSAAATSLVMPWILWVVVTGHTPANPWLASFKEPALRIRLQAGWQVHQRINLAAWRRVSQPQWRVVHLCTVLQPAAAVEQVQRGDEQQHQHPLRTNTHSSPSQVLHMTSTISRLSRLVDCDMSPVSQKRPGTPILLLHHTLHMPEQGNEQLPVVSLRSRTKPSCPSAYTQTDQRPHLHICPFEDQHGACEGDKESQAVLNTQKVRGPHLATTLICAHAHVDDLVPPDHIRCHHVGKHKHCDERRSHTVGHANQQDQQHQARFSPISDGSWVNDACPVRGCGSMPAQFSTHSSAQQSGQHQIHLVHQGA